MGNKFNRGDFLKGALLGGVGWEGLRRIWSNQKQKDPYQKTTYAQFAEDLIIENMLKAFNIKKPSYLDIGAYLPIEANNTYLFYKMGGKGVLVEPNPAFTDKLRRVRPRDIVLNVGIGTGGENLADYYMMSQGGEALNTFSKSQAEKVEKMTKGRHRIEKVIKLPLVNVNRIMAKHFDGAPELLSTDTEGFDIHILRSWDFQLYRPKVICVETLILGTRKVNDDIFNLLAKNGYSFRGGNFINSVFVDQSALNKVTASYY